MNANNIFLFPLLISFFKIPFESSVLEDKTLSVLCVCACACTRLSIHFKEVNACHHFSDGV